MIRASAFALVLAAACGKVETPTVDAHGNADATPTADAHIGPDAAPATWTNTSGWSCASNIDCQDVYTVTFTDADVLNVNVTNISSESQARLAVFAGSATTGTNLVTNTTNVACGNGQGAAMTSGAINVTPGTYAIAVGRDWGFSAGATGTYTVTVTANNPFVAPTQAADDAASNQGHCP
jgi:hypothetical protein